MPLPRWDNPARVPTLTNPHLGENTGKALPQWAKKYIRSVELQRNAAAVQMRIVAKLIQEWRETGKPDLSGFILAQESMVTLTANMPEIE